MNIFFLLMMTMDCWSFPNLKAPNSWKAQANPVPSIVKQYKATFGYSEVEISYTQFEVPQIITMEQFKDYLISQYPKQTDGFPKVRIESIQSCKSESLKCFIALVEVQNQTGQSWVVIQYFRDNKSDYQGMSMIPKKPGTEDLARKIMKGMQNAVSN